MLTHTTQHTPSSFHFNRGTHLPKLLEDMADLRVSLPNLQVKNVIPILLKHVGIWDHGGVCVHIRLELGFDPTGICDNRIELHGI